MSIGDRKRKLTETEDERPAKAARLEAVSTDPFDPSREVDPALIPKGFSPNSYITGTITSTWSINVNKIKKFLLRVSKDRRVEVHITACAGGLKQLNAVVAGHVIALSLENAEPMRLDGPVNEGDKLPLKLMYPKGAIIKLGEKIIDTREATSSEDDWFDTPAASKHLSLDDAMAVGDSVDYNRMSPITEVVTDLPAVTQDPPSFNDILHAPVHPNRLPSLPASNEASNSASTTQPPAPSTVATTNTGTAPDPATSDQPGTSKPKRKRIRKRDTRHANNPALQASKEPNPPKPNGQGKLQNKMENIEKKAEVIAAKNNRPFAADKKASSSKTSAAAQQGRPQTGFTNSSGSVYPALVDLVENRRTQVAGIVVRADRPKQTRSGDWMVTYSLTDPSVYPTTEFSINFFRKQPETLPTAKLEEAMLVKQMRTLILNQAVAGVGYHDAFLWAAYEPAHGREYTSPFMGLKMDRDELRYCHELVDWWRDKRSTGASSEGGDISFSQMARRRRQIVELKDMKDSVFCDCIVQVVKIWQDSRTTDLYVTDFTANPGFGDPNQSNIVMPGKQPLPLPNSVVCKITLWDEVNTRAEVIQPLQFFKLKNVRVRWGRGGNLEGSMGMGKDGKDSLVRVADSDEVLKKLRKRKVAFLQGDKEALSRTSSNADLPEHSVSRGDTIVPEFPPAEHSCVSGMIPGHYYTFVAEVVKVWFGVQCHDVYVTDYTEHPYLMDFSAVEQWQPPPGRRTLHVSVWDDWQALIAGLTTGHFVRFEYMLFKRIHPKKPTGDGKEDPPLLGGKIGEVVHRPCKITRVPATDPAVKELLRRKAVVMNIDIDIPDTPPSLAEPNAGAGQEKPSSLPSPRPTPAHLRLRSVSPLSTQPDPLLPSRSDGPLRNIYHNMPRSTFAELKKSTTSSVWRLRGRVLGFQPGRLRDWAWQECTKCHMEVPNNQRTCSECMEQDDTDDSVPVPHWRFAFVLQDEHGETLPNVFCCDDNATTFLGDLPPQNLFSNREALNVLRTRTRSLLGNIEDVQLHLLRAEEAWQRLQSGKGKVTAVDGQESKEPKLQYGEWADWTIRRWMDQEVPTWSISGCRIVI